MNKNKTNFIIDFCLFLAILVVTVPRMSGMEVHEWLGVAMGAVVVVHLLLHWDWIVSVGAHYFKKLWHSSRLKFFVDIVFFVSFVTVITSGLMISRTVMPLLGLQVTQNMVWKMLHKITGDSTLLLFGLHFALNWSWVCTMFRRYIISPLGRLVRPARAGNIAAVTVSQDDGGKF